MMSRTVKPGTKTKAVRAKAPAKNGATMTTVKAELRLFVGEDNSEDDSVG